MSSNRSMQTAQRRRMGLPNTEPIRGPQTSINSSQMFNNQQKMASNRNEPKKENISNISKMTIAQAITLITLRIGALENKVQMIEPDSLQQNSFESSHDENMVSIEREVFDSIISRIDTLEQNSNSNDINSIAKKIDTMTPLLLQTKTVTVSMQKENKELKQQIEALKKDLNATKELIFSLNASSFNEEIVEEDIVVNIIDEPSPSPSLNLIVIEQNDEIIDGNLINIDLNI